MSIISRQQNNKKRRKRKHLQKKKKNSNILEMSIKTFLKIESMMNSIEIPKR
jgi:hypothetical protein